MGTTRRLLLTVYTIVCLVVSTLGFYWAWRVLRPPERGPRHRPRPAAPAEEVARERSRTEAAPPSEAVEPESPASRDLVLEGFVFAGDGRAIGGGEVALGEAAVPVTGDGTFRLPAAERPRHLDLRYRGPGASDPVAFDDVLAGAAAPSESLSFGAPREPERLRLTLCLLGPAEGKRSGLWVEPEVALVEEWGHGARLRVRGGSNLPDEAQIQGSLEFDAYRVGGNFRPGRLRDGRWELVIPCAADRHLYAGSYRLVTSFNPRLQDVDAVARWEEDEFQRVDAVDTEISATRDLFIGDPEEAREEDLAVERYYRPLLDRAEDLHGELVARVRQVRLLGRGWDPALLEAHERAHAAWFRESAVREDGLLDEERWREFLDEEWRPAVEELLDAHRTRGGGKYQEAEGRAETLLDSLLQLSRLYSIHRVYALFGLPAHENDHYVSGSDAGGDMALLESRVEQNLEALQRFTELVEDEGDEEASSRGPRF